MNIVRIPRLLKNTTLLLTFLGSSLLLSACGGDGKNNTSTSSSSSSSTSSHTFSSTPVTPPLDGTWPNVKVSASGTKALKFDWTAAPNATYYKLWKKANNDSNSTYVQIGSDFTATTISDTVSVHLTDWVNSRYKVQACDASAVCTDSTAIVVDSAMLTAITYVKASNAKAGDWFGWSIAISGDGKTMAVGAPAESKVTEFDESGKINSSPTSGAVYVFTRVNGNWIQEAYLKASNVEQPKSDANPIDPLPNDRFGYEISISSDGNTLAVSAINEDSPSYGINCNEKNYVVSSAYSSNSSTYTAFKAVSYNVGAIYIFKRTNTTWAQTSYIKPSDTLSYIASGLTLGFGSHIALSGDGKTLAVGNTVDPYTFTTNGITMAASSASSVACYEYNLSSSSTSSTSSTSSSSSSSSSNSSSSNSSSVLGGSGSGAVHIFKEVGTDWVEEAHIKASDASPGDGFGTSVRLSYNGDTLAVGAIGAEPLVANSSSSASSIKAIVTINVDGSDYQSALDSGAVYIYKRTTESWQESSKIRPKNEGWSQLFGYALGLSDDGTTLAVGTPGDWSITKGVAPATDNPWANYTYEADVAYASTGTYTYAYIQPKLDNAQDKKSSYASGAVYVYKYSDANGWSQESYLKASNPQTGYQFGSTLSLSGSGDVLAVGCYLESSQAVGIGGDEADLSSLSSGATYVFKRDSGIWSKKSYVKAPNGHSEDRFARALSLDFTGDILAIGAYRESSNAVGINNGATPADPAKAASGAVYIY